MNQRKDNSLGVQDPFLVQPGWFVIDFDSFCIGCGAGLRAEDESRVRYTIQLLKLNADDELVEQRRTVVEQYARGMALADVERYYPFVASELKRQNLTETIRLRFQP